MTLFLPKRNCKTHLLPCQWNQSLSLCRLYWLWQRSVSFAISASERSAILLKPGVQCWLLSTFWLAVSVTALHATRNRTHQPYLSIPQVWCVMGPQPNNVAWFGARTRGYAAKSCYVAVVACYNYMQRVSAADLRLVERFCRINKHRYLIMSNWLLHNQNLMKIRCNTVCCFFFFCEKRMK